MQSPGTQNHIDSVCFDVTNTCDTVTHSLLPNKVSNCGLSPNYVWLRSNLTYMQASVRVSGVFFRHSYGMKSWLSQGSMLGPLLFDAFINMRFYLLP